MDSPCVQTSPGSTAGEASEVVGSLPAGPFGCVLADPPWSFLTYGKKHTTPHRGADDHYGTLTFGELREIPVRDLAAPHCALFMWVVDSHLDEALKLGASWGFKYKTIAFHWMKSKGQTYDLFEPQYRIGMGYWTRKQAESCLLFTRGKPRRQNADVRQIIDSPRREHSRKPDAQYGRIQDLVAGPYLEMFARQGWPGWTTWGNQTDKFEAAA